MTHLQMLGWRAWFKSRGANQEGSWADDPDMGRKMAESQKMAAMMNPYQEVATVRRSEMTKTKAADMLRERTARLVASGKGRRC